MPASGEDFFRVGFIGVEDGVSVSKPGKCLGMPTGKESLKA